MEWSRPTTGCRHKRYTDTGEVKWSRPITGCRHRRYTDTGRVEPPNHWVSTQEIHGHRWSGAAQSLGVDTRDTRTQVEWSRPTTGCRHKRYTDTGGVEPPNHWMSTQEIHGHRWSGAAQSLRVDTRNTRTLAEWSCPITGCRHKRYTDTGGVEPPNHWVSTQEIHGHRLSGTAQSLDVDTRDTRTQVEWSRPIAGCRHKRYTDTGRVEPEVGFCVNGGQK